MFIFGVRLLNVFPRWELRSANTSACQNLILAGGPDVVGGGCMALAVPAVASGARR